jgi:hypothetical protein
LHSSAARLRREEMMHLFGKNEFGTACIRCGYFNHTAEAGEPCSGKYDERRLKEIDEQIARLQLNADLIRKAQAPSLPAESLGQPVKGD